VSASTMQGSGAGPLERYALQESHGDGAQGLFACVAQTWNGPYYLAFSFVFYISCLQRI